AERGGYAVRGPRRWAMRVLAAVLSRVARTRLTDTTSGFKASGPRAVRLFAVHYPAEYLGDTIESLVIASRAGLRVAQLGVTMRQRTAGRPSQSPVKAALYLARACLALAVSLSRRPISPVAAGVTS
ncbi:MAG TPA: glycosyltransferase family 2 protein, partial [Rugosimonospora sp.]|nr:glycosyltransferase family 2 protein [Rugosimonospora sp.]